MRSSRYYFFGLVITSLFLFFGCSYLNISERDLYVPQNDVDRKKTEQARNNSSIILGNIRSDTTLQAPVLIVAYPVNPLDETDGFQNIIVLQQPGNYMMYLPKGQFRIFAVMDVDNDDWFESSEIFAVYDNLNPLELSEGEVKPRVDLDYSAKPFASSFLPQELKIPYVFNGSEYQAQNGQVRKIYDVVFDPKNSDIGLWAPSTFMRNFGANIYFIEEYDPGKIPILFVHGSNGTPQDWVYFLIRLDRSRYQPWFFYYPSGVRLPLIANVLYEKLIELHEQYKFEKLCLSAHSMGGLITRAMLTSNSFEKYNDFIKMYVTLATPWSGFRSADTAVMTSPKKLPVWIDVASRSKFIHNQFRKSLPQTINYYLFFGKEDLVSKGAAVDQRVFAGSTGNYSFDVNHQTILSDRNVIKQYNQLLEKQFFDTSK
ncbi:hypothetical protein KJ966_21705 [bacterium]|nr:hypothetical protein [bacterium]